MSVVAICTDSSALFPTGVAERLGIIVVPIAIALDGDAFDEQGESLDDFYTRLSDGANVTTSQPSPGSFLDAYGGAAAAGASEVLSIDHALSSTAVFCAPSS